MCRDPEAAVSMAATLPAAADVVLNGSATANMLICCRPAGRPALACGNPAPQVDPLSRRPASAVMSAKRQCEAGPGRAGSACGAPAARALAHAALAATM